MHSVLALFREKVSFFKALRRLFRENLNEFLLNLTRFSKIKY
jgi:hypothetical protein